MKRVIVKFRCTAEEKRTINILSTKANLSVSEFCRQSALTGKVIAVPKLSDHEIEYFKILKEHRTNWIRLSNLIKNKQPYLLNEIYQYLQESRHLLNRFY